MVSKTRKVKKVAAESRGVLRAAIPRAAIMRFVEGFVGDFTAVRWEGIEQKLGKRLNADREGVRAIQETVDKLVERHNAQEDQLRVVERACIAFGRTVKTANRSNAVLESIGQAIADAMGIDVRFLSEMPSENAGPLRDRTACEIIGPFVAGGGTIKIAKMEGRNEIGVTATLGKLSVRADIPGQAATDGNPIALADAIRRAVTAVHAPSEVTAPVEVPWDEE